jgi:hypothetical protein
MYNSNFEVGDIVEINVSLTKCTAYENRNNLLRILRIIGSDIVGVKPVEEISCDCDICVIYFSNESILPTRCLKLYQSKLSVDRSEKLKGII